MLASLHLQPERVHPIKPSAQLAREARARHDFDKAVDTEQVQAQRYFSALATWERLLAHIGASAHMGDDDFAFAFEDDIALHDDLSHAAARAAILRGLDLARHEGLLFMGVCETEFAPDAPATWLGTVEFRKCAGLCTHALAVTKRKAATLVADVHASVLADMAEKGYDSMPFGYTIDQMLRVHMRRKTAHGWWAPTCPPRRARCSSGPSIRTGGARTQPSSESAGRMSRGSAPGDAE